MGLYVALGRRRMKLKWSMTFILTFPLRIRLNELVNQINEVGKRDKKFQSLSAVHWGGGF